MSKKYDIYDEHGHKIGTAEEQPSAAEQAVGCLLLLYLLRPLYPFFAVIAVIGGIVYAIFAGVSWVSNFTKYSISQDRSEFSFQFLNGVRPLDRFW